MERNTKYNNKWRTSNLVTIGPYAFSANDLEFLVVPSGVTYIGLCAFDDNSIETVRINGKSGPSDFSTFGRCQAPGSHSGTGSYFGWDSNVTCTIDNISNTPNGCITWGGSGN
jgi:hypothetical protein